MITNFDKYNKISENKKENFFFLAENIDIKLYENENKLEWRDIFNKVINDNKINFNYILTFGLSVNAFLPVVNELLKNNNIIINKESVVLLIIGTLSILFNEKKEDIKKIIDILKEKGIYCFLNDVIKTTKSIKDIFKFITKGIDKTIFSTMDMFAYTTLTIPFLDVIHRLSIGNKYTLHDMMVMGASLALGSLTFGVKNFVANLYAKLKFKIENVSKLQNNQNITDHNISGELTGPKSFEKFYL